MLPPETLTTARLVLSPFVDEDADDVFAYASSSEVARTTSWQPHSSHADSLEFIRFARTIETGRVWAVRLGTDRRAIGSISWARTSNDCGRIDFALSQAHWRRGLMTEAARAVVAAVFSGDQQVLRIESGGLEENVASQRVMHHCGMIPFRTETVFFAKFGELRKIVKCAVDRAAFSV